MTKRISQLERYVEAYRKELKEKTDKISSLESKVGLIQELKDDSKKAISVEEENVLLRKELQEIKLFLKDYGLRWKGSKESVEGKLDTDLLNKQLEAKKPLYNFNLPKEIDVHVIA